MAIYGKLRSKVKKAMAPREISISRPGGKGLSTPEIREVLASLSTAGRKGDVPRMTYRYNPHTTLLGKDPLFLRPKTADLARTAVKVRGVLRRQFGGKYLVHLS